MGKVYKDKICSVCGVQGTVIETWGKYYCRSCWDAKPHRSHGHGGMTMTPNLVMPVHETWDADLELELVKKSSPVYANLFLTHYPKSKGVLGRQCHYLVWYKGEVAGIVGANSPPIHYKKFTEYFPGFTEDNWMNNNVYNLVKHDIKNLGTKTLKLFRQTVKKDYETKYNLPLVGLVTFVEPPRDGAIYKADNWDYLGMTQGVTCRRSGDHAKWLNKEWGKGNQKLIFARYLNGKESRKG